MGCINQHVPQDIVSDILSRLPAKDVLRFRCVSKSWNATIGSRHFIRKHYNVRNKNSAQIMFLCQGVNLFYTFHFKDSENIEFRTCTVEQSYENTKVLRCCNGLLLLEDNNKKYFIWNPSTREFKELPEPLMLHSTSHVLQTYGFCYDSVGDDYKVVLVYSSRDFSESRASNVYELYSLESNSWQQFEHDFALLNNLSLAVFVGRSMHWPVLPDNKRQIAGFKWEIVSFDVVNGDIRFLRMPDFPSNYNLARIWDFEGCLCLSISGNDFSNVWIIKDYGVESSWIKLFSIPKESVIIPLSYSKILLTDRSDWVFLHDLTERRTTTNGQRLKVSLREYKKYFVENLVRLGDNRSKQKFGITIKSVAWFLCRLSLLVLRGFVPRRNAYFSTTHDDY